MLQTVFNSMITIMLAKFVINDVPHALNLSNGWLDEAWRDLKLYAGSRGLFIELALKHDVDSAVSLGYFTEEHISESVHRLKVVLSGYYLIAQGRASNEIVNYVFGFIKKLVINTRDFEISVNQVGSLDELIDGLRAETGIVGETDVGYLGALLRLKKISDVFSAAITKFDKVNAIETLMHMEHEEGQQVMIFVGQALRSRKIEYEAVPRRVELLSR